MWPRKMFGGGGPLWRRSPALGCSAYEEEEEEEEEIRYIDIVMNFIIFLFSTKM